MSYRTSGHNRLPPPSGPPTLYHSGHSEQPNILPHLKKRNSEPVKVQQHTLRLINGYLTWATHNQTAKTFSLVSAEMKTPVVTPAQGAAGQISGWWPEWPHATCKATSGTNRAITKNSPPYCPTGPTITLSYQRLLSYLLSPFTVLLSYFPTVLPSYCLTILSSLIILLSLNMLHPLPDVLHPLISHTP